MMFNKLISLASSKAYEMLLTRGVSCPDCGKPLDLPRALPEAGFKSTIKCRHCEWMGSLSSLSQSMVDVHSATHEKPTDCLIREAIGIQKATWLIPAKKKFNFLMFFALIWLGMISFATVGMMTGGVSMEDGGDTPPWVAELFLIPFWAIGLGVGYIGLRMAYTELLVRVDPSNVVLTRKFFKRMWDKSIPREQVGRVHLSVSHRQNESPIYQIEIENDLPDGKNIKFGNSLSQDDKRWLLCSLQDFLKVDADLRRGREGVRHREAEEIASKTLKIEKIGNVGFRITRLYRAGPWLLGIGFLLVVGTLVGMVVQWGGFDSGDLSGIEFFLDLIFSGLPFLMTFFGFLIGCGLLAGGYWSLGRKKVFEFGQDHLTRTVHWRGERKKEKFDKASFKRVTSTNSGHVNNEPRYKVSIVGEAQTLNLCDYENSEVADTVELWLQHWVDEG